MIKGQERFLSKPFLQNSSGRKCIFMTPMKWFYSFIKPYRPRIFLGLVLVTFLAALAIINPVVSGHVVDDVIKMCIRDRLPLLCTRAEMGISSSQFFIAVSSCFAAAGRPTIIKEWRESFFAFFFTDTTSISGSSYRWMNGSLQFCNVLTPGNTCH